MIVPKYLQIHFSPNNKKRLEAVKGTRKYTKMKHTQAIDAWNSNQQEQEFGYFAERDRKL